MECWGATPLERLCGYIINLFPVPLLYGAELWARQREHCCGAVTALSVSSSLSPSLSFGLNPLPPVCVTHPLSPRAVSRRQPQSEEWRKRWSDQYFSQETGFLTLILRLPSFRLCLSFVRHRLSDHIIGASWPISQARQISSHTHTHSVWQARHTLPLWWEGWG